MSQIIAVDLGGTNIRTAYFPRPEPPPDSQSKVPTNASEGPDAVLSRLFEAIESEIPSHAKNLMISIGAPGPLDPFQGVILEAPNLPGWIDLPLKDLLSTRFECQVVLGNDANVAALGEWRHGAGRGTKNMIYITISTGIGSGVIVDGNLLLGSRGLAGELGHMTIDPSGPRCGCGQIGHLESLASGTAIARNAEMLVNQGGPSILKETLDMQGNLSALEVGEAAGSGDELALSVIQDAGNWIGHHLADLTHAFNPELIILGGGVAQLGNMLFEPIILSLQDHVMHPAYVQELRIEPAQLGDDAGLIGAMVLASLA
jgi:glucokinase